MKLLTYYIAKTLIATTLLVFGILAGLDFVIAFLNEINGLGKGDYGLIQALQFVMLQIPNDVYQLFPMIGLLGSLLGLSLLASHSELIVMRASGFSVLQISLAALLGIVVLVFFATLIGEWLAPNAMRYRETLLAEVKSDGQTAATRHGVWLREGSSFFHIETVLKANELRQVTRYQFDQEPRLIRVSQAQAGVYKNGQWLFSQVVHSDLSTTEVKTFDSEAEVWAIHLPPELLKLTALEPDQMSLPKLYNIMQYKENNRLEYADYAIPFWQRVFQPLATCVMMLLAIPFIFGPLRTTTMGLRMVTGIVVGFTFYLLNQFFGPFSVVYRLPPLLGAIIPIIIFAIVAGLLMRRVR